MNKIKIETLLLILSIGIATSACSDSETPLDSPPISSEDDMGGISDMTVSSNASPGEDMDIRDMQPSRDQSLGEDLSEAHDMSAPGEDASMEDMRVDADMPSQVCAPLEPAACATDADCQSSQECFRGACLETCGAPLSDWQDAMPSTLAPIANVCTSTAIVGVHGDAGCEGRGRIFSVTTSLQGDEIVYTVREGALEVGPANIVGTARTPNGQDHFVGYNAAPNPAGTRFAFSYTRSDVSGEVLIMDTSGVVTRVEAAGNYDLDWLDEDRLLVNGLSAGTMQIQGQGLYLIDLSSNPPKTTRLTIGPGSASGAVAHLSGRDEVLVGGSQGLDGSVYLVDTASLLAASEGEPIDLATSNFTSWSTASDFEWIAESYLAGYDEMYTEYQWRALDEDTLAAAETFVDTGVFFEVVTIPGSPRFLLWHGDGYVIVEASTP